MNAQPSFMRTTSLRPQTSKKLFVCLLVTATGTGAAAITTTGNNFDPSYELTGTGSFLEPQQLGKVKAAATTKEMLNTVSKDLKLSVTATADLFNVSRTAVYKWKEGGAMGGDNLKLLEGLHKISTEIASLKIPLVASKLTSPMAGRESLILMILKGDEPELAFESFKEQVTYSRNLPKS